MGQISTHVVLQGGREPLLSASLVHDTLSCPIWFRTLVVLSFLKGKLHSTRTVGANASLRLDTVVKAPCMHHAVDHMKYKNKCIKNSSCTALEYSRLQNDVNNHIFWSTMLINRCSELHSSLWGKNCNAARVTLRCKAIRARVHLLRRIKGPCDAWLLRATQLGWASLSNLKSYIMYLLNKYC